MTLSRHIMEGEKEHPEATGELSTMLLQLGLAAKLRNICANEKTGINCELRIANFCQLSLAILNHILRQTCSILQFDFC
jgi:hypothetical protein